MTDPPPVLSTVPQSYRLKLISWEKRRAGAARTALPSQMVEMTHTATRQDSFPASGLTMI